MISQAGWDLLLAQFFSIEQLIHQWDEKFWAAQCFQATSQQHLSLLFEEAGYKPQVPFPREDIEGKVASENRLLSISACFWVNRKIEGVLIIHWWLSLCHGFQKSCGLLGCIYILPLILVCAGTFPKISSSPSFPLLPERYILFPSFANPL